ncbi:MULTISPECIES: AMP-binding protein [Burkholderia cepacia complex]|uniref:acetate--CoA ligase n=1 Tax=Burkholderia orbicola TaxID=2978683 RepID=A0ABT8NRE2_9BURK|nr:MULTISPECIES: AMP-binding protein [Burkholderia cepacia complex]AQQ28310.1 AMP-dependent synthetase [Burkholderia cenocepacia]MDN7524158.1 AMP-binding protein [Burkholderia orbicola]ONV87480.1 AMP-dependent synthetase [Burkholderia cenocepacia]ONV95989.1 AMP-dependent synthetase [Burkholderia cenocepacia]ONW13844.1 AMP-dependent synthetase [Burkholderia cenocepacia]
MSTTDILWQPPSDWRTSTLLGELCACLGASSFEELIGISLREPQRYWAAVMTHLQFQWRTPPQRHVDLASGPAFPRWFTGGRLNWVDHVLAHADGPRAMQAAVITETEDGRVSTTSYAALARDVRQRASRLGALGVGAGDRVGVMMTMGAPAAASLVAVAAIGAIAVPLFTGFGADAVTARLTLADARVLLASGGYRRRGRTIDLKPVFDAVQEQMPGLRIVVHGDEPARSAALDDPASAHAAPPRAFPAQDPDQPFMIVFTSGTTGAPKGTVHTHAGFPLKILHDCAYHFELRPGDRWLWPSHMGWIVGPLTTVGALVRGATLVCCDGAPDHPGAGRLAEIIDRHQVTHFGASPTLIRSLAASPDAVDGAVLESLRVLMVAGEVIDPDHFAWFFHAFGRARLPVINYSGGTEASGALLGNVPVRPIRACAFNAVSPGVDVFAADEKGRRVRGVPGELVIAAPFVGMTSGFWNAADRYEETYWRQRPGLWTHGDLLLEDDDGQFFILGRADDTLKIAGKRLGPAEVESVVLGSPLVRDVAAVSLPDPVKGERLVVCVSTHGEPSGALATSLADRIEAALGKPFRPGIVHLVPDLPRTRNGKVMRRVVRNVLRGLPPGDVSALENPAALAALQALADQGTA